MQKIGKMVIKNLQHGARSIVRNEFHKADQGDTVIRESS